MTSYNFAVIGNPIDHSMSPLIHQHFAEQLGLEVSFEKILSTEETFTEDINEFANRGGTGLSVTLPFKSNAYKFAVHNSIRSRSCKAVNALSLQNSQWSGDNTDGIGLLADLSDKTQIVDWTGKRIVIVGAGGAARGIIQAFAGLNLSMIVIVNRTYKNANVMARDLAPQFPEENLWVAVQPSVCSQYFDVCINASSSGMTNEVPELLKMSIDLSDFVYDIFYNKTGATSTTGYCNKIGKINCDGLGMLVHQAKYSFEWWTGLSPDPYKTIEWIRP